MRRPGPRPGAFASSWSRAYCGGKLLVGTHWVVTLPERLFDWNDVITQRFPASNGVRASTQTAINRIVNGQLYLHIAGPDNRVRWYHDTNPAGHPSIRIPDPRTLFGLLNPSAKFQVNRSV